MKLPMSTNHFYFQVLQAAQTKEKATKRRGTLEFREQETRPDTPCLEEIWGPPSLTCGSSLGVTPQVRRWTERTMCQSRHSVYWGKMNFESRTCKVLLLILNCAIEGIISSPGALTFTSVKWDGCTWWPLGLLQSWNPMACLKLN